MVNRVLTTALIAMCVAATSGCDDSQNDAAARLLDAPAAASSVPAEPRRVMTDMMSFAGPVGWQMIGDIDKSMIRAFVDPAGTRDRPNARITIWRTRAETPDLDALAGKVADEWGGRVSDDEVEVAGVPARLIEAPYEGEGLQPVRGLILIVFMDQILIEADITADYEGEIESSLTEVVESWHWLRAGGFG